MRVFGIDPSLTGCGLAVIDDGKLVWSRVISTPSTDSRGERLLQIGHQVALEAQSWLPGPGEALAVAMEGYAMGARFNREAMGEVGGVIKYVMRDRFGCEPAIWANASWKKLVLGNGKLPKDEVRVEILKRYGVELKDNNALEAFAVAMAEHLALSGAKRPRPKAKKKKPPEGDE